MERTRPREPDTRLWHLVESGWFTAAVSTVILCNAVVLAIQTYDHIEREHGRTLDLLNNLFLAIFVIELGLRIAAYGRRPQDFFRSGWNVFDFIVIGAAFVPALGQTTTLLRLARLLRVVRVVRVLPDLQVFVTALIRSIPPLLSICVLAALVFFVYGMVGWELFGEQAPENWGTLGDALLSLFLILTLAELSPLLREALAIHSWAWLYFATFVVINVYILLNVLIGIVLNSMEEARELERRRALPGGDGDGLRPYTPVAPVAERIAILRAALDEFEDELRARASDEAETPA